MLIVHSSSARAAGTCQVSTVVTTVAVTDVSNGEVNCH